MMEEESKLSSNDVIDYKKLYVSSIFENLDQNNERFIDFKKIVNQIINQNSEYDEGRIVSTLQEIHANINLDRVSEYEFHQLYLRLNLIPENFEKNQTTVVFVEAGSIAYNHSNHVRIADIGDPHCEIQLFRERAQSGFSLDAKINARLCEYPGQSDIWLWVQQMKEQYLKTLPLDKSMNTVSETKARAATPSPSDKAIMPQTIHTSNTSTNLGNLAGSVKSSGISYNNSILLQFGDKDSIEGSEVALGNILENVSKQSSTGLLQAYYGHIIYDSPERASSLWGFQQTSETLSGLLERLSSSNQHLRAAAIAVFHFQFARALELLAGAKVTAPELIQPLKLIQSVLQSLKSIQINLQNDPSLKGLIEGVPPLKVTAVEQPDDNNTNTSNSLRKGTGSLTLEKNVNLDFVWSFKSIQNQEIQLNLIQNQLAFLTFLLKDAHFPHPYLQAIAMFLKNNDSQQSIQEILKIEKIEVFDKIAFALRFLKDDQLNTFLATLAERACNEGILECLVLVGKDKKAANIIQAFIDSTRDIQTAGLLSAHLIAQKYECLDELLKWYKSYKSLLNNMRMFVPRNTLDKEFKNLCSLYKVELEQIKDPTKKSKINLVCSKCSKALSFFELEIENVRNWNRDLMKVPQLGSCPFCTHQPFPICSVCLLSCQLINPFSQITFSQQQLWKQPLSRNGQQRANQNKPSKEQSVEQVQYQNLEEALVWCQTCGHGGHFQHIAEWFAAFEFCPVSECGCKCAMI